jgi:hypothetical protein
LNDVLTECRGLDKRAVKNLMAVLEFMADDYREKTGKLINDVTRNWEVVFPELPREEPRQGQILKN